MSMLCQSYFEVVSDLSKFCQICIRAIKLVTKMCQSVLNGVSKLSHSCIKIVSKLYQSCRIDVSKLSRGCPEVVSDFPSYWSLWCSSVVHVVPHWCQVLSMQFSILLSGLWILPSSVCVFPSNAKWSPLMLPCDVLSECFWSCWSG